MNGGFLRSVNPLSTVMPVKVVISTQTKGVPQGNLSTNHPFNPLTLWNLHNPKTGLTSPDHRPQAGAPPTLAPSMAFPIQPLAGIPTRLELPRMKRPVLLVAGFLAVITGAQGNINYQEVTPSNTSGLTGGASPWTERTPYASNGSVWQTTDTSANELATTISGLSPGASYRVSVFIWDATGINGSGSDWHIDTSFTSGGGFTNYIAGGANTEPAYEVNLTNPISGITYTSKFPYLTPGLDPSTPDEISNRDMWVCSMGTAVANGSGEIVAYARHSGGGARSWIDGYGTELLFSPDAPIDISVSNTIVTKTAPIGTLAGTLGTTDPTPADTFAYSLVGGSGSEDNGRFLIDGDRLETDRSLVDLDGPLSIRIRSTDLAGEWTEKVFRITLIADTDLDSLDDDWELLYFVDLTVASGSGNNDDDSLTNLQEQELGTSPLLADTDGDTLADHLENATGVFNGAEDPGSSPLLADSDGDGLDDANEISIANGHITNPNQRDSDGDGFSDPLEISEGTDPNDGTSIPDGLIPLRINEILARNDTGIDDGFGNREDWIELYNPNTVAVNLDDYYLTDRADNPTKWSFPSVSIPANGYLLVFASGADTVDPGGNPHCSFQLSAAGEFLAIVRPDGITIDDSFLPGFPEQFTDISYGPHPTQATLQFFGSASPGQPNGTNGYPGVVKDTNFSVNRGFFTAPLQLTVTTDTLGSAIRYTIDGSKPTPTHGTVYNPSTPIEITTTTTVRAIAFRDDYLPTNVDTHTYLFVEDVAMQSSTPAGWPTDWTNGVPSDYEMDPRVVNNTNGLGVHTVPESLLDIPTVSLTMPQDDFTGASRGIYTHPTSRWERECAVEYLLPDGTPGFQEDCKVEVHGNSSRNPSRMQKHSLRLTFSSSVGTPKLHYPLFPDSRVQQFNKLVLRACFTDSWALASWSSSRYRPNDSIYIRDVWMKDSLGAMGQPTSRGNFVHLYVNGLYFGLHNLTERLEDDWFADHLGGNKSDWLIKDDLSSGVSRWSEMMTVLNEAITTNTVYENARSYIDVENYADYMLLHFYADSEDWPHHNGYAAANLNSGDGRFRFFVWDQEIVLDKYSWNRYDSSSGGGAPFQRLRLNQEFKMLFADRVQKHLFNDGALSEFRSANRFQELCHGIDKAIVAESARWGDVQATTPYGSTAGSSTNIDDDYYPPTINTPIYFTREQHWLVEQDNVVNNYIPTLHDQSDSRSIVRELRTRGLFPSIDAPVFARHGGIVPAGDELSVGAGTGSVYYTLDGSDPRALGGAINENAMTLVDGMITLNQTAILNARTLSNGEWSALSSAEFVVGAPPLPGDLVLTEINYHPAPPTQAEIDAGFTNDDDFEFLELTNGSAATIALSGVRFTEGVHFSFPSTTTLGVGESILVAGNTAALLFRYPSLGTTDLAGEFESTSGDSADERLSNNGERLLLLDGADKVMIDLTYTDRMPWPEDSDGYGHTLVFRGGEVTNALNWRSSGTTGGNPQASDGRSFTGSSSSELMDYALAEIPALNPRDGSVEYSFVTRLDADDAGFELRKSTDLSSWEPATDDYELVTRESLGDNQERFVFQRKEPLPENEFLQLQISVR